MIKREKNMKKKKISKGLSIYQETEEKKKGTETEIMRRFLLELNTI